MQSKYRLGIDAGGTFTDFVLADRTGNVRLFKVLSTPSDPTRDIRDGLQLIADDIGESPAAIVSELRFMRQRHHRRPQRTHSAQGRQDGADLHEGP